MANKTCHVCRGTGAGTDPVFGYRGKCYPCDGTGKAHECGRPQNCYICTNWPKNKPVESRAERG